MVQCTSTKSRGVMTRQIRHISYVVKTTTSTHTIKVKTMPLLLLPHNTTLVCTCTCTCTCTFITILGSMLCVSVPHGQEGEIISFVHARLFAAARENSSPGPSLGPFAFPPKTPMQMQMHNPMVYRVPHARHMHKPKHKNS
jgi:hypothetical protein